MLGFLINKAKEKKVFILFSFLIIFVFLANDANALSIPGLLGISSVDDFFNDPVNFIANAIYKALAFVLLSLAGILVWFGSVLLDVMLEQGLYDAVLTLPIIDEGWRTVRDFCNMFYIFFLLIIAFATILRVQAYSAKNLLVKVIISVILINFSLVITKIVIDFGQVFMFGIAGWMGGGFSGSASGMTSIVDYFKSLMANNPDPDLYALFLSLFSVFYVSVLGLLYIMLAGFLLIRLVYFVILMILSPFAFFSMVLPSMRTYASQWWNALIKNSISGAVFLFFVYLSLTMAGTLTYSVTSVTDAFWVTFFSAIMPHLISLILLWAAIPATSALGAAGTKQIIGGRAGLGKVAGAVGFGAMGGYMAARKGAGLGYRGAKGATSRYMHSDLYGADQARNLRNKARGKLEENRWTANWAFGKKAQRNKEMSKEVNKEKILKGNLSITDRVNNWKQQDKNPAANPKKTAITGAALLESLAEKPGGLSKENLKKAGLEESDVKTILKQMKNSDINDKNITSKRLDLIDNSADRVKMAEKIVSERKHMDLDVSSLSRDVTDVLEKGLSGVELDRFYDKFTRPEKDKHLSDIRGTADGKGNAAARLALGSDNPANRDLSGFFNNASEHADFMKSREYFGLSNFTKDQIQSSERYVNKTHLSKSSGLSQESKDYIKDYVDRNPGTDRVEGMKNFMDNSPVWNKH